MNSDYPNKVYASHGEDMAEYDPRTQLISISRGSYRHRVLCCQIYDVPPDKVTIPFLLRLLEGPFGTIASSSW